MAATLKDELGKREPFDQPEAEAALNVLRTADRIMAGFQRLFRAHGLTFPQYNALRILRGAGQPLPCLEVAARMITHMPDITRLIDRLEQGGLAERVRCPADRRVVHVSITPAGRARLRQLDRPVRDLHAAQLGHLGQDALQRLSRLLERARSEMD